MFVLLLCALHAHFVMYSCMVAKSIISFWSHQLSQVHAGGRVVRTMGL